MVADVGSSRHLGDEAMLLANLDRLRGFDRELRILLVAAAARPPVARRGSLTRVRRRDADQERLAAVRMKAWLARAASARRGRAIGAPRVERDGGLFENRLSD